MAKKKLIKCKNCGEEWLPTDVPTKKEWNIVSPMPDKQGNVTITRMATWDCPNCGKNRTGAKAKTKGEFKEEETPKYKIEHAISSEEKFNIADLADEIGFDVESIKKIIPMYLKKNKIKGKIDGDFFIPG
ncbi:MAG: hypothetical protein ACTSSN_05305 [Candidatus Heimdallarchaeaceae archaeon]